MNFSVPDINFKKWIYNQNTTFQLYIVIKIQKQKREGNRAGH